MKGSKLKFTPEQQAEIRRLYIDEGLTILEVAQRFGVSFTGMNNSMRRIGIPLRDAHRKWTLNPHVFDSIDNEHAAYWHGFIYADGCVQTQRQPLLTVGLSSLDKEHLQKFCGFMQSDLQLIELDFPSRHQPNFTSNKQVRATFIHQHLVERLQETGIIVGRNTVDRVIANVPNHLMHHWIRGLFDGDGAATKPKTVWFCGEESLMSFVRDFLAQHAGRNPNQTVFKHKTANLYYVRYKGGVNALAVADCMYKDATLWLERKKDRIDSWPPFVPLSERNRQRWIAYRAKKNLESITNSD